MNENEFRKYGGEEPMSRDEIIDSAWHGRKDNTMTDWRDELFTIDNLSDQVDWCIEEITKLKRELDVYKREIERRDDALAEES